jgi:hypothetical protein
MSRADAVGLGAFMAAGAAIAVWMGVRAVLRVGEVLSGGAVQVLAEFAGTPAEAPIGADGASVEVLLDRAVLTTAELPIAAAAALVLEQIVLVLSVWTVVATLLWLAANILRGRVFGAANTRLVTTAGLAGIVGVAAVPFFANMGANGAFAQISGGSFDNVIMTADLSSIILVAFIAALATLVFTVGARLQRDTEGLV